jgi:exo-beta-1,3-glucanase (GH17 family)
MKQQDLIRYLRVVREHSKVPITTADDYNFWNKPASREVAAELDFIVTHIYPLWNGKTLGNALPWFDKTFQQIKSYHPDQEIVIGEVGWATNYNAEKKGPDEQGTLIKGEVSLDAQYQFLVQLDRWIEENKITTFLFEAFDELWKGGEKTGLNEIEKNWGVFYTNRKPKESFQRFLSTKKQTPTKMEDER